MALTPPTPAPDHAVASAEELRQRLSARNHVLDASFALTKAVSAELQLEPLCDLVVARLGEPFDAVAVALAFLEEARGALYDKRTTGALEALPALRALQSQALEARALVTAEGAAAVPLVAERKVKGVLAIAFRDPARPSEDDARLLEGLAGAVATAIDNAWLYGEIQKLNAHLEEKVHARTRELEATLEELQRAQTGLVEREKMASLGQLTAGIAHEINNPLAWASSNVAVARERLDALSLREESARARRAIEGAASALEAIEAARALATSLSTRAAYADDARAFLADLGELAEAPAAAMARRFLAWLEHRLAGELASDAEPCAGIDRLLARAEDGLARVKRIVLDLRAFSRLDEAALQDADLDAGIERTLAILGHLAKERGVRVEQRRGTNAPYPCFSARLDQVVLNLATNAIQACGPGGLVRVRTIEEPDGGVTIEVRDDGEGVPEALRARIFDPFFTTKPVGQGVGLGLSISYRIVEEHGGRIEVESPPAARDAEDKDAKGTCFRVRLPPRRQSRRDER
jgi:signal transduction histidine kinase